MKKLIVAAFCLFSIGINAQMQEEKILEDGTHVITYVPRNFTKEEKKDTEEDYRLLSDIQLLGGDKFQMEETLIRFKQLIK